MIGNLAMPVTGDDMRDEHFTKTDTWLNAKWLPDWLWYLLTGGYFKDMWLWVTGHGFGGGRACNRKTCCPDVIPDCKEQHGVPVYPIRPLVRFGTKPGLLYIESWRKSGEYEYKLVGIDLEEKA